MSDDLGAVLRRINRHVTDLAISYTHGRAHGPGLIVQLRAGLGTSTIDVGGEPTGGKPTSRPPGWRAYISELLGSVDRTVGGWMAAWQGHRPRSPFNALRFVGDLVPGGEAEEVEGTLNHWKVRAEVALGYRIPSVQMPGCACGKRVLTRAGWRKQGCGASMLRAPALVDEQMGNAAVWCSNPECHDSIGHPECVQAEDGTWGCRRSDHDMKHGIRWSADEWGGLLLAQDSA